MKGLNVNISNAVKGGTTATITAKAFSDTAMITQIGQDLIYNATNVKIIANYGIVASPSSYNESNSVGEITIQ
jgi:transketolase C-terminal domain/subunit